MPAGRAGEASSVGYFCHRNDDEFWGRSEGVLPRGCAGVSGRLGRNPASCFISCGCEIILRGPETPANRGGLATPAADHAYRLSGAPQEVEGSVRPGDK